MFGALHTHTASVHHALAVANSFLGRTQSAVSHQRAAFEAFRARCVLGLVAHLRSQSNRSVLECTPPDVFQSVSPPPAQPEHVDKPRRLHRLGDQDRRTREALEWVKKFIVQAQQAKIRARPGALQPQVDGKAVEIVEIAGGKQQGGGAGGNNAKNRKNRNRKKASKKKKTAASAAAAASTADAGEGDEDEDEKYEADEVGGEVATWRRRPGRKPPSPTSSCSTASAASTFCGRQALL